jgi:hypothetical protein
MEDACEAACDHIPGTYYSHLSPEEAVSLYRSDDRFDVEVILGTDATRGVVTKADDDIPAHSAVN